MTITITTPNPKPVVVTVPQGKQGPAGPSGPPGKDGTSVNIVGSVPTSASLPTDLGPEDAGDGYIANDTGDLWGIEWIVVVQRRPDPGTSWASGRPSRRVRKELLVIKVTRASQVLPAVKVRRSDRLHRQPRTTRCPRRARAEG